MFNNGEWGHKVISRLNGKSKKNNKKTSWVSSTSDLFGGWTDWPGEIVDRRPVFGVGKTELRDDLQLVLSFPHELKAPLKLKEKLR